MTLFMPTAPKIIAQAKALYERDRLSAKDVAKRVGLHASTVLRYAKAQGWTKPGEAGAASAKAATKTIAKKPPATTAKKAKAATRAAVAKPATRSVSREMEEVATPCAATEPSPPGAIDASPATRLAQAVDHALGVAEKQLEDIERRLGIASRDAVTRERDARTFSIAIRALRDLVAINLAASPGAHAEDDADELETQDEEPADIESLVAGYRERIARVLGGVAAEGCVAADDRERDAAAPDGGGERELEFRSAD